MCCLWGCDCLEVVMVGCCVLMCVIVDLCNYVDVICVVGVLFVLVCGWFGDGE